jgi:glutamate synthase domain-containing protein 3
MITGKISVTGSTGYGAGMYCYGGTMFIKGDVGDFSSTMNKGATIVIGGNVGDEVGTYMTAGELIILGNAGKSLGNYIIRGAIYLQGEAKSLGNNIKEVPITDEEIKRFGSMFKAEGFDADPAKLKKYVPESDKPFYKAKKTEEEGESCR